VKPCTLNQQYNTGYVTAHTLATPLPIPWLRPCTPGDATASLPWRCHCTIGDATVPSDGRHGVPLTTPLHPLATLLHPLATPLHPLATPLHPLATPLHPQRDHCTLVDATAPPGDATAPGHSTAHTPQYLATPLHSSPGDATAPLATPLHLLTTSLHPWRDHCTP